MEAEKRKQSELFLESQGDAYFERNAESHTARKFPGEDRQAIAVVELLRNIKNLERGAGIPQPTTLLEIGCGDGARLRWFADKFGLKVHGIDPSSKAIDVAKSYGIDARVGTADCLPFESGCFDIILFGHCLYLCDPSDWFKIVSETDRVLKNSGWVILSDFFSEDYQRVPYHHCEGIYTHKMDYKKMFEWHPYYTCVSNKVGRMSDFNLSDDKDNLVSVSIIRKNSY